ncbi:MAG TPA: peptide ABC transporter substrate-binding protein, partial [Deltaproteobacteria bacterium]|nr:peptide ABC transporter substrate-binding protein [Deltaproteobacteria bacterium]
MNSEERSILLKVEGLTKHFPITKGVFRKQVGAVKAVDGISFDIFKGETLGLVGESGCGKSTAGRVILQLYTATEGNVFFKGQNLRLLRKEDLRKLRQQMQMIFQDPQESLNPRMTVGSIISEPMLEHQSLKGKDRRERVEQLLNSVGLDPNVTNRYP